MPDRGEGEYPGAGPDLGAPSTDHMRDQFDIVARTTFSPTTE
jgi:hypothetical protein